MKNYAPIPEAVARSVAGSPRYGRTKRLKKKFQKQYCLLLAACKTISITTIVGRVCDEPHKHDDKSRSR